MVARIAAVFLLVCGFAAPAAQAALVEDRLHAVASDGTLMLTKTGPAILQGIVLREGAQAWLARHAGQVVLVRSSGLDRYGRVRVVMLQSRQRTALSWQEQLLAAQLATSYDRAALPKKWLKAEPVPPTITPEQAALHVGDFVVVQGRVTRSFKSRRAYYINFGEDWKTDFSLRIPKRAWRSFGPDFAVTDGTKLRARGGVFLENGPMIELTRPEQLQEPDKRVVKAKKAPQKKRKPRTKETKPA